MIMAWKQCPICKQDVLASMYVHHKQKHYTKGGDPSGIKAFDFIQENKRGYLNG